MRRGRAMHCSRHLCLCGMKIDTELPDLSGGGLCVCQLASQVGAQLLHGRLQRKDGRRLPLHRVVHAEVLRDLADEALERQLADEQLGRLLVLADLAQRDRARAVAVRLLDAATCTK